VLVHVLVEEQRDAPLSSSALPRSSDRHADHRSQEATDLVGGVCLTGDTQKGWS
jgi:hypothetical protein